MVEGHVTRGYRTIQEQRALWAKFATTAQRLQAIGRTLGYRMRGVKPLHSQYTLGEAELRRDRRNHV